MRKLYILEKYFFRRSTKAYHPGFLVSIKLNKAIPDEVLAEAVKLTGEKYPLLFHKVIPCDNERDLAMVPIERKLTIEDVLVHTEDLKPNEIFQTADVSVLGDNASWKLFVDGDEIALLSEHTFFDGMSARNILDSMIRFANSGVRSKDGVVYDGNGTAVEGCHPYERLPDSIFYKFLRAVAPVWHLKVRPFITGVMGSDLFLVPSFNFQDELFDKDGNIRNSNYRHRWNIPAEDLKEIIKQCREHNVTLTVWILAKVVLQLKKLGDEYSGKVVSIDVPMNTRKFLSNYFQEDPDNFVLGNHVAPLNFGYDISKNEEFWTACKVLNSKLDKAKSDPTTCINFIKVLENVSIDRYLDSRFNIEHPDVTFELSNLGVLDPSSPEDTYQLLDAAFNQPRLPSSMFSCSAISTRLGGLTVNISYPHSIGKLLTPLFEDM